MTCYMDSCIPLPLDQQVLEDVSEKVKDWALMHGVCMRSKRNFNKDVMQFAPFLLVPSTFPRKEFEKAVGMQTIINELVHKVAHDYDFLKETLKNTVQVDDFTGRLFQIYETVRNEGVRQPISLGLLRSDYLLSHPSEAIKQVEINTIAASFGALSTVITELHKYTLTELGFRNKLQNLPENDSLGGLARGLLQVWKLYNEKRSVIMFVIEDVTYNISDQRAIEFAIREIDSDVEVIRKTLTDVGKRAYLDKENRLIIDTKEVAAIYFRSGYTPDHYHSELEWDARLKMERSLAIKCPSIHYHLTGTKKVQQELAKPGVLEKFFDNQDHVALVKEVFTGLYSLDFDDFGANAMEAALAHPSRFVLKPQREGGGNNIYGEEVKEALLKMKESKERSAWILMDRIVTPLQKNYVLRPENPVTMNDISSELGIYGVVIGDKSQILVNTQFGYLLRSKLSTINEGGVVAGSGALDSIYLVDHDCYSSACDRWHNVEGKSTISVIFNPVPLF